MQSPTIGNLAKALSQAHGKMKALGKGNTANIPGKDGRQGYSYKYADLADVIDVYRGPLSEASLAITQTLRIADGHMVLVTRLMHESGEFIESEYPLTNYQRPQEQGSAITYARRYTVTAMLGIAAEDDDDGKRAQDSDRHDRRDEPEDDAPPSGDAGVILDLAAELEQITGKSIDEIIRAASEFPIDGGKKKSFTDPRKVTSSKWLKGVREKLERQLTTKAVASEPGVAEAAGLFK